MGRARERYGRNKKLTSTFKPWPAIKMSVFTDLLKEKDDSYVLQY